MSKHTPGPWWVESVHKTSSALFVDAPERSICQMTGPINEEREANARLIAAAPELLEALEGFVNNGWSVGAAVKAKAAIAKAKGEL